MRGFPYKRNCITCCLQAPDGEYEVPSFQTQIGSDGLVSEPNAINQPKKRFWSLNRVFNQN